MEQWKASAPRLLSVLRMVAAITFFAHGSQKILGFPASDMHPPMFALPWFAGIMEVVGGILLFIGLFTRPTAFLLSGLMAFAYWMVHAPKSPFPALNGGDGAILFCFIFLYISAAGPGPWSVDEARKGKL